LWGGGCAKFCRQRFSFLVKKAKKKRFLRNEVILSKVWQATRADQRYPADKRLIRRDKQISSDG
jgi:hypothetical protein